MCDEELGGCGNTCEVKSDLLRRGTTKSCGCIRRERARRLATLQRKPLRIALEMVELRKKGFTYRAIGRLFKLSSSTCHRLVHRATKINKKDKTR